MRADRLKGRSAAIKESGIAQRQRLRIPANAGIDHFGQEHRVVAAMHIVYDAGLEPGRRIDKQRNPVCAALDAITIQPVSGELRSAEKSRRQVLLIFSNDVNDEPA